MAGKVVSIDFASSVSGEISTRDMTDVEVAEGISSTEVNKEIKRNERNVLLAETDWMANSDVTMTDDWKAYRQALRDLPAQSGFPDVDFPTKPTGDPA